MNKNFWYRFVRNILFIVVGVWVNIGFGHMATFCFKDFVFLDTIGSILVTFTCGFIPAVITATISQIFNIITDPSITYVGFIYVLCVVSAIGVTLPFKKLIKNSNSKLSIVVYLFILSILMCIVVSITGGLLAFFETEINRVFHVSALVDRPAPPDYYKQGLYALNISEISLNILSRIPVNLIDRPITSFAAFYMSAGLYKIETLLIEKRKSRQILK